MKSKNLKILSSWDILFLSLIIITGFIVSKSGGFQWEKSILKTLVSFPETIQNIMKIFTWIGNPMGYFILWTPMILFVSRKNKKLAIFLALAILLPALFQSLLKLLVQRNRPFLFMQIDQGGFSYPSGHSTTGISAYFFLSQLFKKVWIKRIFQSMGVVIGISRLFLGVHWPTDVLMGFILGYIIYKQLNKEYFKI